MRRSYRCSFVSVIDMTPDLAVAAAGTPDAMIQALCVGWGLRGGIEPGEWAMLEIRSNVDFESQKPILATLFLREMRPTGFAAQVIHAIAVRRRDRRLGKPQIRHLKYPHLAREMNETPMSHAVNIPNRNHRFNIENLPLRVAGEGRSDLAAESCRL